MHIKLKTALGAVSILLLIMTTQACEQKGMYDYNTPEATYRTYVEQARTLRVVADHRHYRRAIRCFTDEDWRWFQSNFDSLEFDREEDVYGSLYRTKRMAYAFGRAVVPAGPSPDEKEHVFTKVSPGVYELEVRGHPERIRFVESRRGWLIEGLFGLKDKTGS